MIHKIVKTFYTALLDTTKENQDINIIAAIAFGFMQNLQLLEVPVQELFYLSQLRVNLYYCVHNLKTGKAFFYIYHEGIAAKGPDEVSSCIMDYETNYYILI